jgi:hypothetical protein
MNIVTLLCLISLMKDTHFCYNNIQIKSRYPSEVGTYCGNILWKCVVQINVHVLSYLTEKCSNLGLDVYSVMLKCAVPDEVIKRQSNATVVFPSN